MIVSRDVDDSPFRRNSILPGMTNIIKLIGSFLFALQFFLVSSILHIGDTSMFGMRFFRKTMEKTTFKLLQFELFEFH